MSGIPDSPDIERLKLRQIIADIDQKRIDAELKRAQLPPENRRFMLLLVATFAGVLATGVAVGGLVVGLLK